MEIKILCLYNDIMNLYGDIGNIKVLEFHLKELKVPYTISYQSIEDSLDFNKYDLIIIGSGTEENREMCLKHLKKYRKEIQKAIKDNKFFLITGNALGMFGKNLYNQQALDILDFSVKYSEERIAKEVIIENEICSPIYGFLNHSDIMENKEKYLFKKEGIKHNNFYGTYVLGPILSRNPKFLKYFINELLKSKKIKKNIDKIDTSLNELAYQEFIKFKKNKKFNAKKN